MSMSPAELQKLSLSEVVYDDLPQSSDPENKGTPWTIGRLIEAGYIDNSTFNENSTSRYAFSSPEIATLSGMLNWTLVNFQSKLVLVLLVLSFRIHRMSLSLLFAGRTKLSFWSNEHRKLLLKIKGAAN